MKQFLTLAKWEYNGMLLPLLGIVGSMAALQFILFRFALRRAEPHVPFSFLLGQANIWIVFALAFVAVLVLVGLRLLMNFTPSKSIYALLTLPGARKRVYQAKLAAAVLAMLVLVAVQLVLLPVLYEIKGWLGQEALSRGFPFTPRGADFYLTLLEDAVLRRFFPPTLFARLVALVAIVGSVCLALYVAVALKARRVKNAVIFTILWLGLLLVGTMPSNDGPFSATFFFAGMLLSAYTMGRLGVDLFESGEIAG